MAFKAASAKNVGSAEAVAFWLMDRIAESEKTTKAGEKKHDREYWLTLYAECLEVTSGKRKPPPK